MSGTWVKMRVALENDPKAQGLADFLDCDPAFVAWWFSGKLQEVKSVTEITPYAALLRFVCDSLRTVWSSANQLAKEGTLAGAKPLTVDRWVGCPSFAAGMARVGWLIASEAGIQFPNFGEWNRPNGNGKPEEKPRGKTSTERSREHRARLRQKVSEEPCNGNGDATALQPVAATLHPVAPRCTTVAVSNCESGASSLPDNDLQKQPGGATATAPEQNREEQKGRPPKPPKGGVAARDGFDQFWKAYPRKTAKEAAVKAWNRLAPDEALRAVILAAVEQQRQTEQWRRGVYPHPATWLNGKRWEDLTAVGSHTVAADAARREEEKTQRLLVEIRAKNALVAAERPAVDALIEEAPPPPPVTGVLAGEDNPPPEEPDVEAIFH